MKRHIISFLLICSAIMIMVTANVFAEQNNSTETLYYNRLRALEVLPENFDMDGEVTRGEMSEIVCRIYGLDYASADTQVFKDVSADNAYYKSISIAYVNGILNGFSDGSFRPDEPITHEQMVKILVSMAGYDDMAKQRGGYPTGYMTIAAEYNVPASNLAGNEAVTGSILTRSVYKAMEMPIVYSGSYKYGFVQQTIDNDNTLLTNLMSKKNLSYYQGIVNFDGVTHINKSDDIDIKYAEINGERYACNINIRSLLGRCVEFWTNDADEIVYAYEYKDENHIYSFSAEDIDSADFSKYVITDDNNKKTNIKLEKSINVIYNGQGMESFSEEDLIPKNGDVTLIDNDDDNLAEIVIVNDKRYYVVDSVGNGGLSVKYKRYGIQTESGYNVSEDELNDGVFYAVYDENGNEIEPSSISVDSVVSVASSKDGRIISVVLTKKKVDGKIEAIETKKMKINGVEYNIAIGPDGEYMDLDVTVGQTTEAYLNENDEIVYCGEGTSIDTIYGYIINTSLAEDRETWYVEFAAAGNMGTLTNRNYWWVSDKLVQNSAVYTYKITNKAKINGVKNTPELLEGIECQVCEIKTQTNDEDEIEISKIDSIEPDFQYTKGKYNHNTSAMIQSDLILDGYDNPAALLSGNIKTLVIPMDTNEKYNDDCYLAKYRIENDVSTHNVAFYKIPEGSQTPKLIVMRTVLSEVGTAGGDSETCILTHGITTGVDDEDEECYFTTAYDKNGNETKLQIRDDFTFSDSSIKNNIMNLCVGDVLEIGRDGQNRVIEIKVTASASNPIEGTQMGIIEKLQQSVIWNKSNGDDFYNVFFYLNDDNERVEAGVKADYPIFCYKSGGKGYVEKISAADVVTDENGVYADTVIIAGDIAVILPVD